jgi:hypothetical protein
MSKNMAILSSDYKVSNVIICNDDEPENEFLIEYTEENPASIGGDYFDGYFYPEKPYLSWTRNQGKWIPPVPKPTEGNWYWNEETTSWDEVSE